MESETQRGTRTPQGKISYGYAARAWSSAKSTSFAALFAAPLHLHYKSTLFLRSPWQTFSGRR